MIHDGQRVGEYEIIERLGQGGMGAVYKARQASLRRTVALKTLQAALAADPEYITRFRNEAIAAAALNHPNLVQVYSAGETDGMHWFAMEYVEGESAQDRVKRKGRLEPVEAIAIAMHVATALDYGWRKAQLIHRDIKPDNIFLSGDGEVKLGDLGLAKSVGQAQGLTMTGASMGTPHYISPEQAEGKKDVDLRADIYSLGCTLFHLLSGQPPYSGDSALAVMMKHVGAPVPNLKQVWPECPEELAAAVMKMMLKAPAARQQCYGEVNTDLRRAYDVLTNASVPEFIAVTRRPQQPAGGMRNAERGPRNPAANPAPQAAAKGGAASPNQKSKAPLVAGIAVLFAILGIAGWFAFGKKKPQLAEAERAAKSKSTPALPRTEPPVPGGSPGLLKPATTLPAPSPGAASPPEASKDKPFVNSLGMKFVPVAGTQVLFSIWHTRAADYSAYARVTKPDAGWATQHRAGEPVGREPDHPVVTVNWEDAQAFCKWLTEKESADGTLPKGMKYRLPTDEEWSIAVGLATESGGTPAEKGAKNQEEFPWGTGWPPKGKAGNYADDTFRSKFPPKDEKARTPWIEGYMDGFATTSPVGSFPANAFGLYDMGGNAWQWCEDWHNENQKERVLRGASWQDDNRGSLHSASRYPSTPTNRNNIIGFRVVMAGVSAP